MNKTSIEWTDYTWNSIRAQFGKGQPWSKSGTFCTRISPGCTNCYASVINKRFGNGLEYTVPNLEKVEFFIDEKILEEPLRRKKPARIFVGDMFDLFHEQIPRELIDKVFDVMALCQQHTFQILTKRAGRMESFLSFRYSNSHGSFPLPNVWVGVSVESQQYANERIPKLLQAPAAVRFLSVEPLLESVNLCSIDGGGGYFFNCLADRVPFGHYEYKTGIDWVICGGESGPGARPFNLAWAEKLLEQCRAAGVPFFFKQAGSVPVYDQLRWMQVTVKNRLTCKPYVSGSGNPVKVAQKDRKGGDPSEWPEHLRVREFPSQKAEVVHA